MKVMSFVLIILSAILAFAGNSLAEIGIDMSGSNVEVPSPTTMRIRNLEIVGFPGRYWVDLQWNSQMLYFEPVAGQVESPLVDLSGTWSGKYSSNLFADTAITFTVVQNGANLTGTFSAANGSAGNMSGTVKDTNVDFYLSQTNPSCLGTFVGTGTIAGNTMSIEYSGTATCRGYFAGSGSMIKQPALGCTYDYSNWGACQPDGTQTRTVHSSSPGGCTGTPILSQTCTYGATCPTTCNYTYSAWGACQSNGTQTRTVKSSNPVVCSGTPILSQACCYNSSCTYTYSAWGDCQPNGTQTRSVVSSTPSGCTGTPVLSNYCAYTPSPLTGLRVTGKTCAFGTPCFDIAWNAPQGIVAYYSLYRNGVYKAMVSDIYYTDSSSIVSGNQYCYRVSYNWGANESQLSNEVCAIAP